MTDAGIPMGEVLKPCPFCGGEAYRRTYETESLFSHDQVTYTQVGCDVCEYSFSSEPGFEVEAPALWNTRAFADTPPPAAAGDRGTRPYPELLSKDEGKALLERAEHLWSDLQSNNLGGFSGINRPFYILAEFKRVIEAFGHRDVGLQWSKDDLDAALRTPEPDSGGEGSDA